MLHSNKAEVKPLTPAQVIIICGPTACGKSGVAVELATKINGVIINADSAQLYKEVPILTAQPNIEQQHNIPHYLFGMVSLSSNFDVITWVKLALTQIQQALNQGKTPILVGGSGFYLNALLYGLSNLPLIDAKTRLQAQTTYDNLGKESFVAMLSKIDYELSTKLQDKYRLIRAYEVFLQSGITLSEWYKKPKSHVFNYSYKVFKILPTRAYVYEHINLRFNNMLQQGALLEAKNCLELLTNSQNATTSDKVAVNSHQQLQHNQLKNNQLNKPCKTLESINKVLNLNNLGLSKKIIGLEELKMYLNHELSLEQATALACQKTRNYAKRQFTWFGNQIQEGVVINHSKANHILQQILFELKL